MQNSLNLKPKFKKSFINEFHNTEKIARKILLKIKNKNSENKKTIIHKPTIF
jgi:hypothetical protein